MEFSWVPQVTTKNYWSNRNAVSVWKYCVCIYHTAIWGIASELQHWHCDVEFPHSTTHRAALTLSSMHIHIHSLSHLSRWVFFLTPFFHFSTSTLIVQARFNLSLKELSRLYLLAQKRTKAKYSALIHTKQRSRPIYDWIKGHRGISKQVVRRFGFLQGKCNLYR